MDADGLNILPRSFFGRNALLIATLLIISHVVSFFTIEVFVVERHYRTVMYLVSNQIKILHLGSENDLPKSVAEGFIQTTQLDLYWVAGGPDPVGLQRAQYHEGLSEQAREFLGPHTEVRVERSDDGIYVWVNEPEHPQLWVRMPIGDPGGSAPIPLFIFFSMLLFLSLAGAWLAVRQLHRPLKRLAFAAREIGRGDYPGKLKEEGPQEVLEVTQAFNQMAKNVYQLEEDRTLLLAGISHDLRTPITRIRLATEFLSEDNEEIKQGIIEDTQDMDDIIDQFIGYVRHGADEQMSHGDVGELLQQVVDAASKQHQGIEYERAPLKKIEFKPLAMKRLFSNLIENAFRYGNPPVQISAEQDQRGIKITVRDHGSGIADLDKARLFQPFARGDKARSGKGSGLGLAIVQRIVEMHGGEILLDNHPQGGLIVTIILPFDRNHQPEED